MPKEIMGITTYTADEAAGMLGVTRRTLMNYITGGKLAGSKIGGRWAFTEKQLHDFINQGSVIDKRPGMVAGLFDTASKPRIVRVIRKKETSAQEDEQYPPEKPGDAIRREMAEEMPPFMAKRFLEKGNKKG